MLITSKDNETIKHIRKLKEKKYRDEYGEYVIEGIKLINEAIKDITSKEGKLDLMPIPFNKKLDIILSDYAKLIVSKSTDNFVIFFNLINGNKNLQNKKIRQALNQALNQENLLNFVYKKEGKISPFAASINYPIVKKIANEYKNAKKYFF